LLIFIFIFIETYIHLAKLDLFFKGTKVRFGLWYKDH